MAKVLVHSQKLNKAGRISEFNGTTFGELLLQTTENGININDLYNADEVEAVKFSTSLFTILPFSPEPFT